MPSDIMTFTGGTPIPVGQVYVGNLPPPPPPPPPPHLDGSANAPTSTGNPLYNSLTTPVQRLAFSTILNRYHNPSSADRRYQGGDPTDGKQWQPTWNVAGIDYPVGINASTASLPLRDPKALSLDGVSLSGTTFTVNTSGRTIVIDSFDFSLSGGYDLQIQGTGSLTVQNCYFKTGSNLRVPMVGQCDTFTFQYNSVDASSPACWNTNLRTSGTISVNAEHYLMQYNYFINGNGEHIVAGADVSHMTMVYQYNVFGPSGYGEVPSNGGIHGDIIQVYGSPGSKAQSIVCNYNTIINDDNSSTRRWSAQGFSLNSANYYGVTCPTLDCSNNTMVATANSFGYQDTTNGGATNQGLVLVNRSWYTQSISYKNNFIDGGMLSWGPSHWTFDYYPESQNGTGNPTFTIVNNVDMRDLSVLT